MISIVYLSVLSIFYVFISFIVIKSRVVNSIPLEDRGVKSLSRKIRAHANFVEYTPIFLILLFSSEYLSAPNVIIHICAITYIFGRVCHFYSIAFFEKYDDDGNVVNSIKLRQIGMLLTFLNLITFSILNICII